MRELEFDDCCGPVDEASIVAFEFLIGAMLPDAYRGFLKTTNGGSPSARNRRFIVMFHPSFSPDCPDVEVRRFYGLKSDEPHCLVLITALKYGEDHIPPGTIPFARDDFGNEFLLGIAGPIRGLVYFWEHDSAGINSSSTGNPFENVPKLANSFEEFVDALIEAED